MALRSDSYDRLAEIRERLKTNYYWDRLEVPSLVVDEDMEWLIEVVVRKRSERDALRAEKIALANMLAERQADNEKWKDLVKTFSAGNVALEAENERLRTALARFGKHHQTCSFYKDGPHQASPDTVCDCGLSAACQT